MVGKVTTEGDRAMSSDLARLLFGLDGSGIKIGVISDSFNAKGGANVDVLSGDLPGVGNPNGYTTPVKVLQEGEPDDADEGRAMAQIVHDIAPGAELLFYRGPNLLDENEYVQAINALADAGADIIVDDISLIQPLFQDGKVAQAVDAVTSRGVAYFGAVGNSGFQTYESPFRPGQTITINGQQYLAHDFDPGAGINIRRSVDFLSSSGNFVPYLQWSQPFNRPTTRLELFLLDENDNLLIGPPNNDGTDRSGVPLSSFPTGFGEGAAISYWNRSYKVPGFSDQKPLFLVIGKRLDSPGPDPSLIKLQNATASGRLVADAYTTIGSTLDGHANAKGTIAVGASDFRTNPAFGGTEPNLELFSSNGGVPVLFDKDGNPLPQPERRQKPEIVGPNGVSTTVSSSFNPFYGTSAAAPHAAAVAALLLQRAGGRGSLTPLEIRNLLQEAALTMNPQPNFDTGAGFVQADRAVVEAAVEQKTGNAKANRIRGTELADNMFGRAGNDQLRGLGGFDGLFGAQGRDELAGGANNDYLVGNTGKDTLIGEDGIDVLVGGRDADTLTGGKRKDVFLFNESRTFTAKRPQVDTITDFQRNEIIALSTTTFTTFLNPPSPPPSDPLDKTPPVSLVPFGSNPSFSTVETREQAQQSEAAIVYIQRTGAIYYNANGAAAGFGGGGEFAKVSPGLELAAKNFIVVS